MNKKRVAVIGGGTGTFVVLTALKNEADLELSAIVCATDSGGSTGRLRDEYGSLPVGDIRQCLAALAADTNGNNLLRELFLYRFSKGDVKGHNFGNLFLTAMTDILGSEQKAIKYASKVLNVKGQVVPICYDDIDLVAEYEDGSVLVGEKHIDEPNDKHNKELKIIDLRIQPKAEISNDAKNIIEESDYIITGPGDLYSSILSNFVVNGADEAMSNSNAKFIYITNLMTKYGQTNGLSASDQVEEVAKYAGRFPDYVLVNNQEIPESVLKVYFEKENAQPIEDDFTDGLPYKVFRRNLISEHTTTQKEEDAVTRSLIRHGVDRVREAIVEIINQSK